MGWLYYITFKYSTFQNYTLIFSSVRTFLALTPLPPCTHVYAFSLTPPPPPERTYFMDGPVSDDYDFQLHLKRPTNSCFYFYTGLLAWEANMAVIKSCYLYVVISGNQGPKIGE